MQNVYSEQYGTLFDGTTYLALKNSVVVSTIVAPASNNFGIIIYQYNIAAHNGKSVRFASKTSAPTGFTDTTADTLFTAYRISSAEIIQNVNMPIRIPPGYGLYEVPDAIAGTFFISMHYKVY